MKTALKRGDRRPRRASRWTCALVLGVAVISLAAGDERIRLELSVDPTGTRFSFRVTGPRGTPFTLVWAPRRAERATAGSARMDIPIEHPVLSLLHGGTIGADGTSAHAFTVSDSVLPDVAWLQVVALDPAPPHRPRAVSELYEFRRGPPATVSRAASATGFRWDVLALVIVAVLGLLVRYRPALARPIAAVVLATGLVVGVAPRLPLVTRITTDPVDELAAVFPRDFADAFEQAAALLPAEGALWIPWTIQFIPAKPTVLTHRLYPSRVVHFEGAARSAGTVATVYRLAPIDSPPPDDWRRDPVPGFSSATYRLDRVVPLSAPGGRDD